MVKDFNLNLDSFQRFRRILPEIKSQTAEAAPVWGFQVCFFSALEIKKKGQEGLAVTPSCFGRFCHCSKNH